MTHATLAGIADETQRERVRTFAIAGAEGLTPAMVMHVQKLVWNHTMELFARCQGAWGASPLALASVILQSQAVAASVIFEMASPTWKAEDGKADPIDPMERVTVAGDFLKAVSEDYGRWLIQRHALNSGQAGRA